MNESILDELKTFLREDQILISEPMSRHTTFRCGGPAALFLQPLNKSQFVRCVKLLRDGDEPFFLLGNGSNLLVSDKGYEGCIIQAAHLDDISLEHDTQIRAECGALNSAVASFAKDHSLTGFEFAAGTIEFKVCKDHSWNPSYPAQGNYILNILENGIYTLTIYFNPAEESINAVATKTGDYTLPEDNMISGKPKEITISMDLYLMNKYDDFLIILNELFHIACTCLLCILDNKI